MPSVEQVICANYKKGIIQTQSLKEGLNVYQPRYSQDALAACFYALRFLLLVNNTH